MLHVPTGFNPSIAHIADGAGNLFQVLNEAGDDWDEAATIAQRDDFYNQQGKSV